MYLLASEENIEPEDWACLTFTPDWAQIQIDIRGVPKSDGTTTSWHESAPRTQQLLQEGEPKTEQQKYFKQFVHCNSLPTKRSGRVRTHYPIPLLHNKEIAEQNKAKMKDPKQWCTGRKRQPLVFLFNQLFPSSAQTFRHSTKRLSLFVRGNAFLDKRIPCPDRLMQLLRWYEKTLHCQVWNSAHACQ